MLTSWTIQVSVIARGAQTKFAPSQKSNESLDGTFERRPASRSRYQVPAGPQPPVEAGAQVRTVWPFDRCRSLNVTGDPEAEVARIV
jgi:hypothetical protein